MHVLGLLIMQYPAGSPWERVFGWRFLDPWDAIAPYAAELPPGEPLVVLSHFGLSLDARLAQRVPRIDLLLGGHSHDTLAQPGTPATCRSFTPARTEGSSRAANSSTRRTGAGSCCAISRCFRCWKHRDARALRFQWTW